MAFLLHNQSSTAGRRAWLIWHYTLEIRDVKVLVLYTPQDSQWQNEIFVSQSLADIAPGEGKEMEEKAWIVKKIFPQILHWDTLAERTARASTAKIHLSRRNSES